MQYRGVQVDYSRTNWCFIMFSKWLSVNWWWLKLC